MLQGLRNQLANKVSTFRFLFSSASQAQKAEVVQIDYSDLQNKDSDSLYASIEKAYSDKGLGILLVRGVPDFQEKRVNILKLSQELANLPKSELEKLEAPEFHFGIGWSHGREQFNGQPDFMKGSFYANPIKDRFASTSEGAADSQGSPGLIWNNKWPTEHLPELKPAFNNMATQMRGVGI